MNSRGRLELIVFGTGEPGIGKTALIDEFQRQAGAKVVDLGIARGQCVEGCGSKEAYYPVLEALGGVCRGSRGACLVQSLAVQAPAWRLPCPPPVRSEHRDLRHRAILGA